jgi:hypothetical protein
MGSKYASRPESCVLVVVASSSLVALGARGVGGTAVGGTAVGGTAVGGTAVGGTAVGFGGTGVGVGAGVAQPITRVATKTTSKNLIVCFFMTSLLLFSFCRFRGTCSVFPELL